jgi:hypothetical protein
VDRGCREWGAASEWLSGLACEARREVASGRATAQLQTGPSRPRHRFNGAGAHVASAAVASGA